MKFANRIEQLPPYLFVEISRKIAQKKAEGIDVISFGIGDPDIPTPHHVIERLRETAADAPNHRYPETDGLPEFRRAVAAWYDRRPLAQRHTHSDGNQMPKYAEGIALMRLMTGSVMNREIDAKIWKWIDDRSGEDGLVYKQPGQADAYGNGRTLLARILDYRLTGAAGQSDAVEKTIDTLWDKVYVQGDRNAPDSYCIFPRVWDGGSQVNADTADWPIYNASLIAPMVKWHQMSGSSRALDLARWMTNSILRDGEIAADGSWLGWFHPFVHTGIADSHNPAVAAGAEGFQWMKTETPDAAKGPNRASFVFGSHGLSTILDDVDAVLVRNLHDGIHVGGPPS